MSYICSCNGTSSQSTSKGWDKTSCVRCRAVWMIFKYHILWDTWDALCQWIIIMMMIIQISIERVANAANLHGMRIPDNGLGVRVLANRPRDLGSIPGRVIPKTQKMVLDTSLLNTQHYKVRIKGKVEQSREGVAPSPTP